MKTEKYMEFKEKYLPEYDAVFFSKMQEILKLRGKELQQTMKEQIEQVISNMVAIQKQVPVEVGCIQISLLLSSIYTGKTELMYEVYDGSKELGKLLYAQAFQVDWLLPDWEDEKAQIQQKIKGLNLQHYLSEEAVNTLLFEKVDNMILLLVFALKYDYRDFMSYKKADELLVVDGFYLSIGEYRGFQKVLYQQVKEKDIFQERIETDFSFMKFNNCHYKEKRFVGHKLDNVNFENCVFLNTIFKEVDLQDAEFKNCVFRECVFEQCILNGCEFLGCDLQRIEWKANQLKSGLIMSEEKEPDICRPTAFVQCILHKHKFKENVMAGLVKFSCDEADIVEKENEIF